MEVLNKAIELFGNGGVVAGATIVLDLVLRYAWKSDKAVGVIHSVAKVAHLVSSAVGAFAGFVDKILGNRVK